MKVWLDGQVREADQARVLATDHGMTVGDGVFETCKVVDGVPFALTRHLARLAVSAAGLGLPAPADAVVRAAARELCAAEPVGLGRLRITWTGGPGPLGSDRGSAGPTLSLAVTATEPWPETTAVAVVPWVRNERSAIAGLKTTSYAENVVALQAAHAAGASEAVFANTRGELCEGTGTNILVAVDGELVTPPLTAGCLAGITRALLLDWANQEGLPVREQTLPLDVIHTADEVLLTSSTRDVQPVHAVDERRLAAPGPLGRAAVELFARRAGKDLDP